MFAPRTVFLDLETTGLSPLSDGITEIAAIVCETGHAPREWATLVRPPHPIPDEISRLTGITNAMVRDAPRFAEVAGELAALLQDALLVAHNARFDYAFLKHAFEGAGMLFTAPTLCTARLARALEPGLPSYGLDALAHHYDLATADRHRALGDSRLALALAQTLVDRHASEDIEEAVKRVLRRPSLPKHLAADALLALPRTPGVYLFYGQNAHPLYIGKARDLRERVGAHFSGDWGSERGARLSEELRRIEVIETAGELSALLLEARLVRERLPAHNVRLRRRDDAVVLRLDGEERRLIIEPAASLSAATLAGAHGPFSSRRALRATLAALASEEGLCLKALGLEKRRRGEAPHAPCFAYQVRRCRGACCGVEAPTEHWQRLADVTAPLRLPTWPHAGPVEIVERHAASGRSARVRVDHWCVDDNAFDHEALRIVRPYVEGRKRGAELIILPA
ncbi:MAG: exonuclease domain-containing protein [Burkholderiales bacterium]